MKITAVIPTYNRAKFVRQAVESVLTQTAACCEIIVVDDGSTDDTRSALAIYESKVRYIYKENSGVSSARNRGILEAKGDWIAFLDSDDKWKKRYIATQMNYARTYGRANLCMQSADAQIIGPNGPFERYFELNNSLRVLKDSTYCHLERPFAFLVAHGPWQVGATIFLREALLKAGKFDETLSLSEDFDLMARVSLLGSFGLINQELVEVYRRLESTECLTDRFQSDPLAARISHDRLYLNLFNNQMLTYVERRALSKVIGANKRAVGNLLAQRGDIRQARFWYRRALYDDPSVRSVAKLVSSHLPTKSFAL